jgi:hypothetical protein
MTRMLSITEYSDAKFRDQVIQLWVTVFGCKTPHNTPVLAIDKKLSVHDGLFFVALVDESVVRTVLAGYDGHRGWLYSVAASHHRNGMWAHYLM